MNKLEITPDKQFLAAAGNPAIRLFEVNGGPQPVLSFEGHTGNVTAVGFERDGRWMFSGSEDGTVKLWDIRAPGPQREYESRGAVTSVVLHPNQARARAHAHYVCSFPVRLSAPCVRDEDDLLPPQSEGLLSRCGLVSYTAFTHAADRTSCLHPPCGPTRSCAHHVLRVLTQSSGSLSFLSQGELLSSDSNGNIRVWDLTANACSYELVPEVGCAVRSLSVAADGTLVVAANSRGVCYCWRLQRGLQTTAHFEPLHKLVAHPDAYILKCLLSPDGRLLATCASDTTVKLWSLDNFTLERTLTGHTRWVWDAVFSVDAAYLVTASSDTTARLWDCASGEAIRVYSGHHKAATCCALNDSATGE